MTILAMLYYFNCGIQSRRSRSLRWDKPKKHLDTDTRCVKNYLYNCLVNITTIKKFGVRITKVKILAIFAFFFFFKYKVHFSNCYACVMHPAL